MQFHLYHTDDLIKRVSRREGETKLGEQVFAGFEVIDDLKQCPAPFVVFGVAEDVGPRANCGKGGADSAWEAFLSKFLNVQHSRRLPGNQFIVLGKLDVKDLEGQGSTDLNKLRKAVSNIDEKVSEVVEMIRQTGKIPILIGGGHNNAYGLLKGCSMVSKKAINACNLDPHADYRALEGRHSGNGFSYAREEGFLGEYMVLGLHENYNSQDMLDRMAHDGVKHISFESIFLKKEIDFEKAIALSLKTVSNSFYGIELDMDSIQDVPSSAQSPSGISANEARQYVYQMARSEQVVYLHLPEAAPRLVEGSEEQVGKLLSYLVTDFAKGYLSVD